MAASTETGLSSNVFLAIVFLISTFSGCRCIPDPLFGTPECRTDVDCLPGYTCAWLGTCIEVEIPDEEPIIEDPPEPEPDWPVCEVAACVRLTDCAEVGLDYPQCIEGCCEDVPPEPPQPCWGHLDECESEDQSTEIFYCDATQGRCLQRCAFDGPQTLSADCPLGAACFESPEDVDDPQLGGVCVQGDCIGSFDEHECGEEAHCLPHSNGASYCWAAGELAAGEPCTDTASQCGPELFCLDNACVPLCTLGDGCELPEEECLQVFDVTSQNQPGFCGTSCTPHSSGECGEASACVPAVGRLQVLSWFCKPLPGSPAAPGELCDPAIGCVEGHQCGQRPGEEEFRCVEYCDAPGDLGPDGDCSTLGEVCVPSQFDDLAHCLPECAPYPRRPADYGCEQEDFTCAPFVSRSDVPVLAQGHCIPEVGTADAGEACSNPGTSGGDCLDRGACGDFNGDGESTCAPLCDPFAEDPCAGQATCSGIPALVGRLELSYCLETQAGELGDRCESEGFPCEADASICLDFGGGTTCHAVCREGFGDCEDVGGACITGELNPDVVPSFMGLCR